MKTGELLKKAGVLLILIALIGSAFLGWAKYKKQQTVKKAKPLATLVDEVTIDTVKAELLRKVYNNLDVSRNEFLIDGYLSTTDGADSTANIIKVKYIFSRKGDQFYYKLDQLEMFNTKSMIIYVDAINKKVLLSRSKEIMPPKIVPAYHELIGQMKEEGYRLISKVQADHETITMSNPSHVACKEYGLTFNSLTLQPERLHARLSSFEEPENDQKDKIVDLYINKTGQESGIKNFLSKEIVIKEKGKWQLSPAYSDYQLINTL